MVQIYFLTEVFLFVSAGILLADKYGMRLLFLINMRDFFYNLKQLRLAYYILGTISAVLTCIFPIDPGPVIIGDIFPVLMVLISMLYFLSHSGKESIPSEYTDKKRTRLGLLDLLAALLHLIIPSVVLI